MLSYERQMHKIAKKKVKVEQSMGLALPDRKNVK
jgi:hypothetical protein